MGIKGSLPPPSLGRYDDERSERGTVAAGEASEAILLIKLYLRHYLPALLGT